VSRILKTTPITAPDTLTPPQQANGKPTWQAPQTPRGSGGMSTGKTGGNFADASLELPVASPADAWDMGSQE
jgi:hypothetical protein